MDILKTLAINGVSMLLALLVAFWLLSLFSGKKGCSCGGGMPSAQTQSYDIVYAS